MMHVPFCGSQFQYSVYYWLQKPVTINTSISFILGLVYAVKCIVNIMVEFHLMLYICQMKKSG